jgi:hypothetical protein
MHCHCQSLQPQSTICKQSCGQCYKTFYSCIYYLRRYRRNSVKILEKYAAGSVITAVKSLQFWQLEDSTLREGSQVLPANIRLGWKRLAVTNDLAYYLISAVKSFRFQTPGACTIKLFMAVIYRFS